MQFSTFALAALSIGCALAESGQVNVHVVTVGNAEGSLTYSPNNIVAAKGDMVQFQFMPKNHSVVQSNFDNPCQPISMHSSVTGVFSGFMPVEATDTTIPTFTILINATTPMWIYCAQAKHCQSGMSMVINQNTTANATRSLENYQMMAMNAAANLAPGTGATDGTTGSTTSTASAASASSTGSSGYGGSGYGSASSTTSSTTSSSSTKQTGSSATAFKAPAVLSLTGLFAVGVALFM